MKTDKELLELAAKAVDACVYGWFEDESRIFADIGAHRVIEWNPLTDDGDALRLAVKLGIVFDFIEGCLIQKPHVRAGRLLASGGVVQNVDSTGWDAATRRAIVRAAASIGEKL